MGATRLLGRVHDFVDVLLAERAGVPHLASGVVGPERPFPPGQQQLGQVRQAEEAEVPAGARAFRDWVAAHADSFRERGWPSAMSR